MEIPTVKPDNDLTRPLSEEHADALMAEMTRRENAQIEKETPVSDKHSVEVDNTVDVTPENTADPVEVDYTEVTL